MHTKLLPVELNNWQPNTTPASKHSGSATSQMDRGTFKLSQPQFARNNNDRSPILGLGSLDRAGGVKKDDAMVASRSSNSFWNFDCTTVILFRETGMCELKATDLRTATQFLAVGLVQTVRCFLHNQSEQTVTRSLLSQST